MADNLVQSGTGTVATDDIGGVHYQRMKVGQGADGVYADVSAAAPLAAATPNSLTVGTITAANANLITGTATAGSSVAVTVPDSHSSWDVYLTGTYSAGTTLHFQGSLDGVTWWALNGRKSGDATTNVSTTTLDADPPGGATNNPSNWRGSIAGIPFFRVTCSPYTAADSVTVRIVTSAGTGAVFFNAGLPGSSNNIGALYPTPAYTIGSTTGTTPATIGQIGRPVRASGNVAQATAATLIAAPAAGTRIYVTNIIASNEGATLTVARLFAGSLPAAIGAVAVVNDVVDLPMAASGGGAVINFPPNAPWALPVATALSFAVTVATTWTISVTYYVSS